MAANTVIDLVSLDFDALKASYLAWLQNQNIFKDYNFAGAALNLEQDLLSVNTFRNAFFLNMAISEGFIDSAQQRTSILSHVKELNYLPRSALSASANVTVTFTATGASQPYVISKGQSFSSQIKNQNYIFTIPETLTCASSNTTFTFTTPIYEGIYVKDSYMFNFNPDLFNSFPLTNQNPDVSSLVVNVFENNSVLGTIYQPVTSLLGLDQNSKVYFVQTNAATGNYEILFGDGVAGYQPKNGALIVLDYRVTVGAAANGAKVFSINFDPTAPDSELIGNTTVTTNDAADSGGPAQSLESIRFYGPRWFQTQERAVIPQDYAVLLANQFPEISAVNVYGGETLSPPQFGKVVVAINITGVAGIPQSKSDRYTAFIQPRMPLSTIPIFVGPEFTYIQVNTTIRYNINVTTETKNRISTLVLAAISAYNTNALNNFNVTFRYSQFSTILDNADPSIISNITDVSIYKKFIPINGALNNVTLNFAQPLVNNLLPTGLTFSQRDETCLTSSAFMFNGTSSLLADDGTGNINIIQASSSNYIVVIRVGSINYNTGLIQLVGFTPDSFDGSNIKVYVKPRDNDISCSQNTLLSIEPDQVDITIQQLTDSNVDRSVFNVTS